MKQRTMLFCLKIEESIGHVWFSQYYMTQFEAFGCLVGGFHSSNNYIAAIIDSIYGNCKAALRQLVESTSEVSNLVVKQWKSC